MGGFRVVRIFTFSANLCSLHWRSVNERKSLNNDFVTEMPINDNGGFRQISRMIQKYGYYQGVRVGILQ